MEWVKFIDRIRSLAADYSRRIKLDTVEAQRILIDWMGDSVGTDLVREERAFSLNKKYQALVVRVRLKSTS